MLHPELRSLSLKHFTALIFKLCPGLQPYAHMLDEVYARFLTYKQTVPVMGAIMLDPKMEKCLLVSCCTTIFCRNLLEKQIRHEVVNS